MGRTTSLRREMKSLFFPFMEVKGFQIDQLHAPHFIDFRRADGERVQFFEIQWEKYGRPRFVANFGQASIKGTICHNTPIPSSDVSAGQAPAYCRLHPGNGSSTRHWFRQDRPLLSALFARSRMYPPDQPIQQLITLFAEAENYWRSNIVGPHSKLITNQWAHNVV